MYTLIKNSLKNVKECDKSNKAFLNLDLNSNSLDAGFSRYVDSREKCSENNIQGMCNI